ncbi:glutamine--fructose-6-phosphate transaminase (isomerizing) [Enterococcus quebecensis]|uniref:Glutamine--fructose-6-phosphate aminotransferase [isomerizing] n=1 Tax=Enterococcus quebecensis TaxID=903983 RepID=A0A1E5GWZ4_9ENTE|nr:glutamine--fructose-6-phosphate transaminase (isomerizing) [Enterococcus quebecensis]OEG17189.1 glutamine--fructose-6-phosphate aminotransferase [Enterococcus quebecensis]OJG75580.1 glutamine-fructose-6-phosphate transaminase (isomerizing) [Enterococcus quebecensis]
MCGIVGIIGKENATEILIQGLEKLEYRGYDSAGIFVSRDDKQEYLVKSLGRIADLKKQITPEVQGTIGIGHTRWATHGKPSEGNAHPHTSNNRQFILVHNGVIENFEEIKEEFLKNFQFEGDTDTEIVVNLIQHFAQTGMTTKVAMKKALTVIRGSYAFALIDKNDPTTIYVAKNKSPLLIGLGDDFNVICSDAMAMLNQTNHFVEIADGELVTVQADKINIEDEKGNSIYRESYEAQLDLSDIEKGTYPYYMLKEIDDQPTVMRRIIQEYTNAVGTTVIDEQIIRKITASDRIYIIACGTSYHAGWVGKAIIEKMTTIPVEVHLSSEFGYNMPLLSENPFFIFLSQSGETADSRQVLVQTNALGLPSLTVTNGSGSTLSREADYTLLLHAGPEIAVASTKAYTAQIAVLALLAKAVGDEKGNQVSIDFNVAHELSVIAAVMETIIDEKMVISQLVEKYLTDTRNAFYIGRGVDYYVSMEAALKLKEISYIQAEGFAAGELKHGTIALIEEGTPVFGVITDKKTAAHTRGNLKEVESRGANNFVIALASLAKETDQLVLPDVHPLLTPLVSILPTQLIAYFATLQRGYDVDKPRNLAKSVTVE